MEVVTQGGSPTISSLVRRALDRQATLARARFKLSHGQVKHILQCLQKKNASPSKELITALKEWPISDENMTVLLEECRESVMLFGPESRSLVEAICEADWRHRPAQIVQLHSAFTLDLVTAHNYHTTVVLTALMKKFKANEGDMWEDQPPSEHVELWSEVHSLIAQIVAIMPMSTGLLLDAIVEQFPYYKAGAFVNRAYIHNLIWITRYIPSLLEQIMTVMITRLVIMDVSCTEMSKQSTSTMMDTDEKESSVEDCMDYCMLDMLRWLMDERNHVLTTLCNVFERVVLPTHGTRHIQFLLLLTISISQKCADRVLDTLWVVAAGLHANGLGAIATRRLAATHLSGLLARSVRLPNTRLVHYLDTMAQWCHDYIKATQESTTAMCDSVKMHGAFHAICHAIFYLVAFKHQHLFATKESINFVESLNLPRLITCALNPLRTCPPAVIRAFASVTRAHQVVYCQAVIEKNTRHSLQERLDVDCEDWFPYDPYTLHRSGKLVWPLCVEYKEWVNEREDDTQYSRRVNKKETDEDDFISYNTSKAVRSLSSCISPGFKYI